MSAIETFTETIAKDEARRPTLDQNGHEIRYTGPGYKWDARTKPSKGSKLRIKPDGSVSYESGFPKEYKPGSKPYKMPALNARIDKPGETFARLKELIEKQSAKVRYKNYEQLTGRPVGNRFHIAATDGIRALLAKGPGSGEYFTAFDKVHGDAVQVCCINNPEFHLALKRAAVMTNGESHAVRFIGKPGELKLMSRDDSTGDSFEETIPLGLGITTSFHFTLDAKYVEPLCGTWPLQVYFDTNEEHKNPVVFGTPAGDWEYIVMPIVDKFNPADYDSVSNPEESKPEPEPEAPAAEVPSQEPEIEAPAEVQPVTPESVKREYHVVRMIIGEAVSHIQVREVVDKMLEHLLTVPKCVVRGDVLTELGGNMVVMTLEFDSQVEAMRYSSDRVYLNFLASTQVLLIGNYVLKLFENHCEPIRTPEPPDYGPVSDSKESKPDPLPIDGGNRIQCPQCCSFDVTYYDGALGYEAVRCNACNIETDLNDQTSFNKRTDNLPPGETENEALIDLLWNSLKRDPEHKDRRQTGWGTKTKVGLVACIRRIMTPEPAVQS